LTAKKWQEEERHVVFEVTDESEEIVDREP
jgi:hypothetical protein